MCSEISKEIASRESRVEVLFGPHINKFRAEAIGNIRSHFPSPHSELLIGVLLGADELKRVPRFNDILRETGTIHVAVVSGYNISLVYVLLTRIAGSTYRPRNFILSSFIALIYAFATGFNPPVIRSWLMAFVVFFGKLYGRNLNIYNVLFVSALLMLFLTPTLVFSLSFQLSFAATLSLVMFSDIVKRGMLFFVGELSAILDDFIATIAAQVLVWPIIALYFEQVSPISPIVNGILLWTIPLSTVLGLVFLFLSFISKWLSVLFSYLLFVPLDIFVQGVALFDKYFDSVVYSMSYTTFVIYYLLALFIYLIFTKIKVT